ncbi:hypothetical protein Pla52n_65250 [Stieleria varia]|uniref:Uncharacterized protein n=2 Tax=Stieleria varia TaxID=2528005 RepID=A0A5C5ZVF1_9BACT|nr:hypothetical protein Pla52n_65250 [Stieleria varia]
MLAYFALVGVVRDSLVDLTQRKVGKTAADVLPIVLVLPSLGFFLGALLWAERMSKRFALFCPECGTDVSKSTNRVLATRCCSSCEMQIVEGRRTHGADVFERFSQLKQRRFLIYWFWIWPVFGLFVLAYHWFDQTAWANCPQALFIPGLIGTTAAGWAFARTIDMRYLPQLGVSALVFLLGVDAFW